MQSSSTRARSVQPGRGVLRDADRAQAVHGIDRHGGHLQAQAGRASSPSSRSTHSTSRCSSGCSRNQPADRFQSARELLEAVADAQGARLKRGSRPPSAAAAVAAPAAARTPTPQSWIDRALSETLDVLLIDHANCEKKAASTALALDVRVCRGSRSRRQDVAPRARGAASLRAGREADEQSRDRAAAARAGALCSSAAAAGRAVRAPSARSTS